MVKVGKYTSPMDPTGMGPGWESLRTLQNGHQEEDQHQTNFPERQHDRLAGGYESICRRYLSQDAEKKHVHTLKSK